MIDINKMHPFCMNQYASEPCFYPSCDCKKYLKNSLLFELGMEEGASVILKNGQPVNMEDVLKILNSFGEKTKLITQLNKNQEEINNDWDKAFEEARNHAESSATEKGFWEHWTFDYEQYLKDNYLIIEKEELPIDGSLISIKLSNAEWAAITKYPFTADIAPSDSHYNDIQNYRREGFVQGAGWFANLRHKQKIYTKDQVEQAILMAREDVGAGEKFGWRYGIDDILNEII